MFHFSIANLFGGVQSIQMAVAEKHCFLLSGVSAGQELRVSMRSNGQGCLPECGRDLMPHKIITAGENLWLKSHLQGLELNKFK